MVPRRIELVAVSGAWPRVTREAIAPRTQEPIEAETLRAAMEDGPAAVRGPYRQTLKKALRVQSRRVHTPLPYDQSSARADGDVDAPARERVRVADLEPDLHVPRVSRWHRADPVARRASTTGVLSARSIPGAHRANPDGACLRKGAHAQSIADIDGQRPVDPRARGGSELRPALTDPVLPAEGADVEGLRACVADLRRRRHLLLRIAMRGSSNHERRRREDGENCLRGSQLLRFPSRRVGPARGAASQRFADRDATTHLTRGVRQKSACRGSSVRRAAKVGSNAPRAPSRFA